MKKLLILLLLISSEALATDYKANYCVVNEEYKKKCKIVKKESIWLEGRNDYIECCYNQNTYNAIYNKK